MSDGTTWQQCHWRNFQNKSEDCVGLPQGQQLQIHPQAHTPLHPHSVLCLLAWLHPVEAWWTCYQSSTRLIHHLCTGDDLVANLAAVRRTSSTRTYSRLIWFLKMFQCSAKTVRATGTIWLLWAQRLHGMRLSSGSSLRFKSFPGVDMTARQWRF